MRKHGFTEAGKQRWRCVPCGSTGVRSRPDVSSRNSEAAFLSWASSKETVTSASRRLGVVRETASRRFSIFLGSAPAPLPPGRPAVLALDAVTVAPREAVALVAADVSLSSPCGWSFACRESFTSWFGFLSGLRDLGVVPEAVVCDGQRGLLLALRAVWPEARVQRCLIHVHRQALAWLTRHPMTEAGQSLRLLVSALTGVATAAQSRSWAEGFRAWDAGHAAFLKERTFGQGGSWWYTHRRVRAVRSLLRNALPSLFLFTESPSVPRTSNHVEGGINSRIKELLRSHRGLKRHRRIALVSWYLVSRQRRKATRNVT